MKKAVMCFFVLAGCGRVVSYPLTTCIVCDRSWDRGGGPVTFVHEGYEIKTCTEEHRREFESRPAGYLKKIREVKAL